MAQTEGKYNIDYLGFGQSFVNNSSHNPIVGNEIFLTYTSMMDFVTNNGTCCIGTLLKVTDDKTPENNGVYLVKSYGASGKVEKLGSDTLANYQSITYPTEFKGQGSQESQKVAVKGAQNVKSGDTLNTAVKSIENTISGLTQSVLEYEFTNSQSVNKIKDAIGLDDNLNFSITSKYNTYTSIKDVLQAILDSQREV